MMKHRQVYDQLWVKLSGQLEDQLQDQLWVRLKEQLWDQIEDQLWGQLWFQLRYEIGQGIEIYDKAYTD